MFLASIMIVRNKTKKTLLSQNIKRAESLTDQTFGLLRKSNPRSLFIKTRFGIHTFFLAEPIDVLVLDKDYRVVKLKEKLNPNNIFLWNPKYFFVIELPHGTIKKSHTETGNQLSLL